MNLSRFGLAVICYGLVGLGLLAWPVTLALVLAWAVFPKPELHEPELR